MQRWIIGTSAFAFALAAWSRSATAQEAAFGHPGQLVVGVERISGVHREHLAVKESGTDQNGMATSAESKYDTTTVALLGTSSGISVDNNSLAGGPSTTPRIAFDAFVTQGLSLGGSLMYMTSSGKINGSTTDAGVTTSRPERNQGEPSLLLINPRIGYAVPVTPQLAIWPRAGFSYARYGIHTESVNTLNGMPTSTIKSDTTITMSDVSLDVMLAIQPVPHFAILVGPYADIGVGGSGKTTQDPPDLTPQPDTGFKYTSFGLAIGLGGVF
jgi:hypothetical protein